MTRLILISCLLLSACGADGDPQPPVQSGTQSGLTMTGEARIGVVSP